MVVLFLAVLACFLNSQSAGACFFKDIGLLDSPLLGWPNNDIYWCDHIWGQSVNDLYFDNDVNLGFVLGNISGLLSLVCAVGAFAMSCAVCQTGCLQCLSLVFFVEGALSLLSFVSWSSNFCDMNDCTSVVVIGLTVGAAVAAFLAGGFCMATPPHRVVVAVVVPEDTSATAPEAAVVFPTVEETLSTPLLSPPGSSRFVQETRADGTTTTTQTTVNADGSMTIVETVETSV